MCLSNKALLANLQISQWTGRKLDKTATHTVETEHSTGERVGNYTKKLLPAAKELEEIQRIAGNLRTFFYEQSLPWYSDGSRIISSKNYMDFVNAFRAKKSEFDSAVRNFLQEYPYLRERARAKLGDLFRETEYPSVSRLQNAFACEVTFCPVPDIADFRVEVLDSEKEAFLNRMRETESNAMRECWTRLYDVVSKAANKLQSPGGIFRDSLIENIHELCALLPRLNVSDDPNLEAMRIQVEELAARISPDACRASVTIRNDAASQLTEAMSKMSAFMGV